MSEQELLEEQKVNLVNDLIALSTVMDEIWSYHPDNPDKKDIVEQYKILERIKSNLEQELEDLK